MTEPARPCFLDGSLGDQFLVGDLGLRRGEIREGECLGDDHGDLPRGGDPFGERKARRDTSLRGDKPPGDLDPRNRRGGGDVLLGDGLTGDFDSGEPSGEYLSDGDLERDTLEGEHDLGDRDDLCNRGDLDRDENPGDLLLGDKHFRGGVCFLVSVLFGDRRGEGPGDNLGLGEYRDDGDLRGGDRYLADSRGDLFCCLIGDLLGDLLDGDLFRDRDLGDDDLPF